MTKKDTYELIWSKELRSLGTKLLQLQRVNFFALFQEGEFPGLLSPPRSRFPRGCHVPHGPHVSGAAPLVSTLGSCITHRLCVWSRGHGARLCLNLCYLSIICDNVSMTSVMERGKLGENFTSNIHSITSQTKSDKIHKKITS